MSLIKKIKKFFETKLLNPVRFEDVSFFSRQLSTLLSSGIPLSRAFKVIIKQAENPSFKIIVEDVNSSVIAGLSFSEALHRHPAIFSNFYVAMVKCGEKVGALPQIMNRLADIQERDLGMIKKFKAALSYPIITLFFAFLVLVLLMKYVFPSFIPVFNALNVKLPFVTKALIWFSNFISSLLNIVILILLFAGCFSLLAFYIKTPKGRLLKDRILIKLPIYKVILPHMAVARFCRTLSLLYTSGSPLLPAFKVTKEVVDNKVYEEEFKVAIENMVNGASMSEALHSIEMFPRSVLSMFSVGEISGNLSKVLKSIYTYYDSEVEYILDRLNSLFEPILILFLGGMIGVILIAILLPLYSVIENIGV